MSPFSVVWEDTFLIMDCTSNVELISCNLGVTAKAKNDLNHPATLEITND